MAERPIFVPSDGPQFVTEISFRIAWNGGFATIQKKKNVAALHSAAAMAGYSPLLEVSTKSEEKVGQHLSAFHLKVPIEGIAVPLECVFQGSKIFARGGPYTDLYRADPISAKRDPRLRSSGNLVGFEFEGQHFGTEPKTAFYDWLYVNAIFPHRDWLSRLSRYAGFTDIEFNPAKSINCQARSCALFMSLMKRGLLQPAVASPSSFVSLMDQTGTGEGRPVFAEAAR